MLEERYFASCRLSEHRARARRTLSGGLLGGVYPPNTLWALERVYVAARGLNTQVRFFQDEGGHATLVARSRQS